MRDSTRSDSAWLALAYRSAQPSAELWRIALGPGPDADAFPPDVLEREADDARALRDLGVRLLTCADAEYPARLRDATGPILLQVAGRAALLEEEGVTVLAGHKRLGEVLDAGDRAVVVLSKGMLKAKSLLAALQEPIADGMIALVTAEPPRAVWGPIRDRRRDALCRTLSS